MTDEVRCEIDDPVAKYEAMTAVARAADAEPNIHSIWVYDHFHTVPEPTLETTFECWTISATLARDTERVRIGHLRKAAAGDGCGGRSAADEFRCDEGVNLVDFAEVEQRAEPAAPAPSAAWRGGGMKKGDEDLPRRLPAAAALDERYGMGDSGYKRSQTTTLDEWLKKTDQTAARYGGPGSAELHVFVADLSEDDRWDLYHLEDAVVIARLSGGFVAVARRPRRRR